MLNLACDHLKRRGKRARLHSAEELDDLVDAAVSPEGMRFIFAAAPLAQSARPGTIRMKANEMRFRRVAFDRFELTRSDGAALRFRLHGMGWKLEAIQLPPDAL
jgi:hypothetical protein